MPRAAIRPRVLLIRGVTLAFALWAAFAAGWAFIHLVGGYRPSLIDWVRTVLLAVTSFWLVWGSTVGLLGALSTVRPRPQRIGLPQGRTAILVPVYNEDPAETFARIAAMNRQLVGLGVAERFHFAVLSDTTSLDIAAQELSTFARLLEEPLAEGRLFYRRRERNVGRKAGNIEDFVSRSGAAYDYAVILDADSLMEGETLVAMALRMDADPRLGLLQTVPEVIGAESVFGRMMAFSSAYMSPYFARGVAVLQGEEGPYWGHNAIVRMRAFAQSCGLPELPGKPPHGGHILSHDYVEAALLARAGWKVEVDPGLGGSYERGPDNLIEFAKRDRRWCQGNLQHRRLVFAPGLRTWSRFAFVQGIMAYMTAPVWMLFLFASVLSLALPDPGGERLPGVAWSVAIGVAAALLLPKLAIGICGAFDGTNKRFGGSFRVALSLVAEILLSTLLAPVLLAYQSRAVVQVLFGLDGGWPATERNARIVPLGTAFQASWWIALTGGAVILFLGLQGPSYLIWLLPVAAPATLAPFIIWLTSHGNGPRPGALVFATGSERHPSPVILEERRVLAEWGIRTGGPEADDPVSIAHAPA